MKSIIFVIPTLRIGGAEKSLVSLLKVLSPDEAKVDLLLFEAGGPLQSEVPDWINIIEADPMTRGMLLELRFYLKDMLRRGYFRAAAVRLWMSIRPKFFKKSKFRWSVLSRYLKGPKKKYDVAVGYLEGVTDFYVIDKIRADRKIGWIHSDFTGRLFTEEDRQYYSSFDCLVTISEKCKRAFEKEMGVGPLNMEVIQNISLPEEIIEKSEEEITSKWDEDSLHIVTVGNMEYAKGIDVGARACRILRDRGRKIIWHVYGDGSMRKGIERYISDNNLQDSYRLEGRVANPYPFMKKADIIVQPSRWEGKSVVLDEAKILGKAIVVTDYTSVTDQIADEKNGVIVECSPKGLVSGIERLTDDNNLKEKIEAFNKENMPTYKEQVFRLKEIIGIR